MRSSETSVATASTAGAFGAFMPDGSYNRDAGLPGRGRTDRFVRQLAAHRGGPLFSPGMAAEAIRSEGQDQAFPNHGQWATLHSEPGSVASWPFAQTSTSAEEAVKRGALGASDPESRQRHWCGELWVDGAEKACSEPGHRREIDPARLAEMLSGVLAERHLQREEHSAAATQIEITETPNCGD